MTISSTTRKAGPFTGNGATVAFPFVFKVFTTADVLVVQAVTATGVETTLALGTNYTVSLNADQNANPGGTVITLVAPPTGTTLTTTSQLGNLQPMDLTNAGGFYPSVLEDAADRTAIQIQQLAEGLSRAVKVPISNPTPPAEYLSMVTALGASAASSAAAALGSAAAALGSEEAALLSKNSAQQAADSAAASAASIAGGPVLSVNGRGGAVSGLQEELVSGSDIKTVNGESLLGYGNLTIAVGLTVVPVALTSQTATAGNNYVLTNVAATAVTLPTVFAAGDVVRVTPTNGLYTNTVDAGSATVYGRVGSVTGIITLNLGAAMDFTAISTTAWVSA